MWTDVSENVSTPYSAYSRWLGRIPPQSRVKVKIKVILLPTFSWPVFLCVRPSSGTRDQLFFSFFLKSSLDICRIVTVGRPLCWEDGSVIYRFCLTSPVLLGSEFRLTHDQKYCLRFKTAPPPTTWRAMFPHLFPTGIEQPSYTSRHWVAFCRESQSQSQSYITTDWPTGCLS
jgi:hypothetical protein